MISVDMFLKILINLSISDNIILTFKKCSKITSDALSIMLIRKDWKKLKDFQINIHITLAPMITRCQLQPLTIKDHQSIIQCIKIDSEIFLQTSRLRIMGLQSVTNPVEGLIRKQWLREVQKKLLMLQE